MLVSIDLLIKSKCNDSFYDLYWFNHGLMLLMTVCVKKYCFFVEIMLIRIDLLIKKKQTKT